MSEHLLAADTAMGPVTLLVADLDSMTAYYRDGVLLDVLASDTDRVTLGRAASAGHPATPIVILEHAPALQHASPGQAGLFHTAILFDSRAALASALYSVATKHPGTFTGSADHFVSQAFYFTDPEGNGVELYWDRDRSEWSWVHGSVEMGTVFLDPNAFLAEHLNREHTVTGPAVVGHVHLSVGDTATAKEFYVGRLGFEPTMELPGSALFVSAGKYHHHLAMNVWNSRGAGRRQPTLGLGRVEIVVPNDNAVGEVADRLQHFGVPVRNDGARVSVDDPWGNLVTVEAAPAPLPETTPAPPANR